MRHCICKSAQKHQIRAALLRRRHDISQMLMASYSGRHNKPLEWVVFHTTTLKAKGLANGTVQRDASPCSVHDVQLRCSICLQCMHQRCTQDLSNFSSVAPVAGPAGAVCCHAFDVISPLPQEAGRYLQTYLRIEEVESNSYLCTSTRQRPCAARIAQQSLELMPPCRLNSVVSVVSASMHAVQQSYPLPVSIHLRVQEKRDLYGHVA